MKNSWTRINETERRYFMPNKDSIVINNPRAIYISESRTHYISNEDDTQRTIIPWPFTGILIKVNDSSEWVFPEPRFPEKTLLIDQVNCGQSDGSQVDQSAITDEEFAKVIDEFVSDFIAKSLAFSPKEQ
jgi:hypothetical protein